MLSIDWSMFLIGALGAFAPEIVRLWELRTTPDKFVWSTLYVVASFLMCILGGVVAVMLAPDTAWKIFYAGLTAPVLISVAAKKTLKDKSTPRLKGTATSVDPRVTSTRKKPPALLSGASAFLKAL